VIATQTDSPDGFVVSTAAVIADTTFKTWYKSDIMTCVELALNFILPSGTIAKNIHYNVANLASRPD
jgi:hypothetical protein